MAPPDQGALPTTDLWPHADEGAAAHTRLADLAAVHVVNAIAAEDVDEFEAHLAECEVCAEAIKGLRRVVVFLSHEIADDKDEMEAIRRGRGVLSPPLPLLGFLAQTRREVLARSGRERVISRSS